MYAVLPVPPPLHVMARRRLEELSQARSRTHFLIDGTSIDVMLAGQALANLGAVLGAHDDLQRLTLCLALERSIRFGSARPERWPNWARNAVVRYAQDPGFFAQARPRELSSWGLGFAPARVGRSQKSLPELPRPNRTKPGPLRTPSVVDLIEVPEPRLMDPGKTGEEITLSPGLVEALADIGWSRRSALAERWLRVAVMHSSYLYEQQQGTVLSALVLRMLEGLGLRWVQLFLLEEFLASEPMAEAGEQSRILASMLPSVGSWLSAALDVCATALLGKGEALQTGEGRESRARTAVTWQLAGVMCLFGGSSALAGLVQNALRDEAAHDASTRTVDWSTVLQSQVKLPFTWAYESSGPDDSRVFRAVVTAKGGKTGAGTGKSKRAARRAAAECFCRKYLPEAVRESTRAIALKAPSVRPVGMHKQPGESHKSAITDLCGFFELPKAAVPLLSQALTHSSWIHEHQAIAKQANQIDNKSLARLGAAVADALVAHDQVVRIVSQGLDPTEDEARLMPPAEERLQDLFNDFNLGSSLLLGAGVSGNVRRSIAAGAMQAVLAVAWKYRREHLLVRRPRLLDEWLRVPNGAHDPSTALQQMCSAFKIAYDVDHKARGSDHDKSYACTLSFEDEAGAVAVTGPFGSDKTQAKHLVSAKVLAAVSTSSARTEPLTSFFLRRQIAHAESVDPRRALLRGWLGVSHLASADLATFGEWADSVEKVVGPVSETDLAKMRGYYARCLLLSRRGTPKKLRSTFSDSTEWLRDVDSAAAIRADSRWESFRAAATTLDVITSSVTGTLREAISEWYSTAISKVNVDLSSENLGDDQDDLTATQASAVYAMLSAAAETLPTDNRLEISVYRRDGSAYVTMSASIPDLQSRLSELARLLDESVSHLVCVPIERGWLIELEYVRCVTLGRLADLGRSLAENGDERRDLLHVAKRASDYIDHVEKAWISDISADYDLQERAADLFACRALI
jgi:dsRNA-specific ribonuclease